MFNIKLYKNDNLNLNGTTKKRIAIRAVIEHSGKILLVHSSVNGDYKFPGGGVEKGETFNQTLIREVLEESGYHVINIFEEMGIVDEFDHPMDKQYDYFYMISHYFRCDVDLNDKHRQNLAFYEDELGFLPVWVDLDKAINTNKNILNLGTIAPPWTERETRVLELLKNMKKK
ncbi:MAG: NUDIX domain-containing protein [Spirochaetaceae bacterium]